MPRLSVLIIAAQLLSSSALICSYVTQFRVVSTFWSRNGMVVVDSSAIEKYRETSKTLADPVLAVTLRALFDRRYSLSELLDWIHEHVKFDKGTVVRHLEPQEILAFGRGRCAEFSILFMSLCLAHNYRARLILDMSDHVWTEIWDSNQDHWLHVDPSEKRIDDPYMYERDWKKHLQKVYAFENGDVEDVTQRYKLKKH